MVKRIFLVGFMGCGKSVIGRQLAEQLHWNIVDMDTFIEREYGKTIAQLFEEHGEREFRTMEQQALKELVQLDETLISTGGGSPCFFDNMQRMLSQGLCIYLKLSAEELTKRLQKMQDNRPLIRGKNEDELRQFIYKKLEEREPFYSHSQISIDCNGKNEAEIVQEILEEIKIK